jgi:hypothetical protein
VELQLWNLEIGIRIGGRSVRWWSWLVSATAAFLLVGWLPGCEKSRTAPGKHAQQSLMRRADRGEALLKAVASQLADLPSAVDTTIRPPAVILDASKSADGAGVLAICTARPTRPNGPLDYVTVPAENGRFRSLGVRSGDILKYFIQPDETVDEERRQAGFTSHLAREFTIAQVIDENTLLIEKGIPERLARDFMEQMVDDPASNKGDMPRGILMAAKIEIWRNLDDRLIEINQKLGLYADRRLPPLGWEPSPDEQVLSQIVAWLNQWLRQSQPETDWSGEAIQPLLQKLTPELAGDNALAPYISAEALAEQSFQPQEGRLVQEAVWHRDISRWAQGSDFSEVSRAVSLFDWTVRNVQLVADEQGAAHRPWQVLIHGRGTAEQRAWVFAMLCRQQGMDVVLLGLSPPESRTYLAALLAGEELYLFDARLGLAIPGAGGEGVATLAQALADDSVLRQLDTDDAPYPLTAEGLKNAVPYVVADWFDLSRRAWQVEAKLSGENRLILTSRPVELAERLKKVRGIGESRLWDAPFRTLRDQLSLGRTARRREALAFEPLAVRPLLWKARALHFQGRRSSNAESEAEAIDDHRRAAQLYTDKSVRPTDRHIAQTESVGERRVDTAAKVNATYWVGLLSFDDARYDVAAHWLGRPELRGEASPWAAGSRYNLARTFEAQEKLDEAVALLEQDASPQAQGNRLRARALRAKLDELKTSKARR